VHIPDARVCESVVQISEQRTIRGNEDPLDLKGRPRVKKAVLLGEFLGKQLYSFIVSRSNIMIIKSRARKC
jgi:hypothetical protein